MLRLRRSPRAGFSLLEIVIAVSVLAILAGVISLRSGAVLDRSRATKACEIVQNLKVACASYHADTDALPREYAGYSAASRDLSAVQNVTGWSGPYIESPFGITGTSPYGGTMHLYDRTSASGWTPGFDLDGDGTIDVSGAANMLYFASVDEREAQLVDEILDAGAKGTWQDSGRVQYLASGDRLLILVYY